MSDAPAWGQIWEPVRVLVTARTYPTPAKQGIEVSCTAGITDDGRWIRLFPVPYRFLDDDKRFHKYQWIDLKVSKAKDYRPESRRIDQDSIQIVTDPLPTVDYWRARREIIAPLQARSLCAIQAERNINGFPTLGFFKPKEITGLIIEADSRQWTEKELARLRQEPLFGRALKEELEKLPFRFKYSFVCDDSACTGHELTCVDWEMGQSYRKWSRKYADWEDKFRERYEWDMMERRDTSFFVGNQHQAPTAWIIVGLFYPPKQPPDLVDQLSLF
jgi:hypothetical protein